MGTRGTTGFIIDGERKSGYQQYDSYLDGVGLTVLEFARKYASGGDENFDIERVDTLARGLKIVSPDDKPTADDLKFIGNSYHQNVSSGDDWYAFLRGTQGNPASILDSGYITGNENFRSEEFDYVLDLDQKVLVVYAYGDQIGSFPFASLPTDEEFIKTPY